MKYRYLFFTLFLSFNSAVALQNPYWDIPVKSDVADLRDKYFSIENDTLRLFIARDLGFYYEERNYDSSLFFFRKAEEHAIQLKQSLWEAEALTHIGFSLSPLGYFPDALKAQIRAQNILNEDKGVQKTIGLSRLAIKSDYVAAKKTILGMSWNYMGIMYVIMGDDKEALLYYHKAEKVAKDLGDASLLSWVNMNFGESYRQLDKLDSSLIFSKKALKILEKADFASYQGFILNEIGNAYRDMGIYDSAEYFYRESIRENQKQDITSILAWTFIDFANLFKETDQSDSVIHYAMKGMRLFYDIQIPNGLNYAYQTITLHYETRNLDSAYHYLLKALEAKDRVTSVEKQSLIRNLNVDAQVRLEKLEKEKLRSENRNKIMGISSVALIVFIIAFILYRSNRQKQKANVKLTEQKEKIQSTLEQLKATQSQLIQSEKMASLGELTAGIAHEIQNPLNFVNNFSDVSQDLIDEMQEELNLGNPDVAREISEDVKANLGKIHQHGSRASGIVKGMLEHSRTSDGKKEPTDLNAVADEYLRLAYHGLRAKDKNFNADFKTDFDESLPKVNVIPQDIGRVLLNLINNAFYAVDKKSKDGIDGYKPEVIVRTKKYSDSIQIYVKDNGPGIPEEIKDKIFQPFFTTKPTGSGTGLGLSLSYDIVKAHGGSLEVSSNKDDGAIFTLQLPISENPIK